MNTRSLAKSYAELTAEERFRLILAAGGRGDDAERQRLVAAGRKINLTVEDHAPHAHALGEISTLTFLELLEDAAVYLENLARPPEDNETIRAADDWDLDVEGAGDSQETADAEAPAEEVPAWEAGIDLVLAAGFVLKTKAEGWKVFCARLQVPPFLLWEMYPGFGRLRRALTLAERAAFAPEGFLRWLNRVRPRGKPALSRLPWTVEDVADANEEAYRQRVRWWGG